MKKFAKTYWKYLIVALLMWMPIFGYLDDLPIRIWDEARVGINAYEMLKNGDFIVTYFQDNPDLWNTKPPLLIWLQVLSMKFLGVNEFALRLPSAFAAVFTCLALLVFAMRYNKQFIFGFFAVLILITTHGYIGYHVTRNGDYDALLTMFTTVGGLFFFAYIETEKKQHLYLFFVTTALAVLTKSVTGLFFIPALFIYTLYRKKILVILKNKHFYFGILIFVAMVFGYYFIREWKNPGYLQAVYVNELGGRFFSTTEAHQHEFAYFFNEITSYQLSFWHYLVPLGMFCGLIFKDKRIQRITVFSSLMVLVFFLIISSSQTKLPWYSAPLFPFTAILVSVFIYVIFSLLQNSQLIHQNVAGKIIQYTFLVLILIIPYRGMWKKVYKQYDNSEFYQIGYLLQNALHERENLDGYKIVYQGERPHLLFYVKVLNDKGIDIEFVNWENLAENDLVIACQPEVTSLIEGNLPHTKINQSGVITRYKIEKLEH